MCESHRNAAQATYKGRLKRFLNEQELQGKEWLSWGQLPPAGSPQPTALRGARGQACCFCLALGRAFPRPLPPREPHVGWWLPRGTWSGGGTAPPSSRCCARGPAEDPAHTQFPLMPSQEVSVLSSGTWVSDHVQNRVPQPCDGTCVLLRPAGPG